MSINGADWLAPSLTYKNCQVLSTQEGVILKRKQLFQISVNSWNLSISKSVSNIKICHEMEIFGNTEIYVYIIKHFFLLNLRFITFYTKSSNILWDAKGEKICKLQNRKEFSCCNIHFHLMLIEFKSLYICTLSNCRIKKLQIFQSHDWFDNLIIIVIAASIL